VRVLADERQRLAEVEGGRVVLQGRDVLDGPVELLEGGDRLLAREGREGSQRDVPRVEGAQRAGGLLAGAHALGLAAHALAIEVPERGRDALAVEGEDPALVGEARRRRAGPRRGERRGPRRGMAEAEPPRLRARPRSGAADERARILGEIGGAAALDGRLEAQTRQGRGPVVDLRAGRGILDAQGDEQREPGARRRLVVAAARQRGPGDQVRHVRPRTPPNTLAIPRGR
jgi:hypothetical protein